MKEEMIKNLKHMIEKFNLDMSKIRFGLSANLGWMAFVNTVSEGNKNNIIDFYMLNENGMTKTGFITYGVGKGFWKDRQVNFYKLEVDDNYRKNGIATYGLSFLTEIANNHRLSVIDGNFYPSDLAAKAVYDKNGFKVEKEYYDVRIVKSLYNSNLENILKNTNEVSGIKIYNNHRKLYMDNHKQTENEMSK